MVSSKKHRRVSYLAESYALPVKRQESGWKHESAVLQCNHEAQPPVCSMDVSMRSVGHALGGLPS